MAKPKNDGLNPSKRYNLKKPTVSIRLTVEQKKKLMARAEGDGVTIAMYVQRILDGIIASKEEADEAINVVTNKEDNLDWQKDEINFRYFCLVISAENRYL